MSSGQLSGYIKAQAFSINCKFIGFEVGNIGPGLRLLNFHKMFPRELNAIICNIITDLIIISVKENNKMYRKNILRVTCTWFGI